jgi:peptidoglycan-associated lipoprotein
MKTVSLRSKSLASLALSVALSACASHRAEERSAANPATDANASSDRERTASAADRETSIRVSEDVRQRCNLEALPNDAPKFDYDRTTLRARGRNVLDEVAKCLVDGPLSGQVVTVVGRTDPRGSEVYNDALGAGRAQAARDYLAQRGVSADRIRLVSRGELGARGTDEDTYALDRRVDIELGDVSNHPIVEGTMKQIETSRAHGPVHPEAASYADSAEGGKPVGESGSGSGVSSESVHVGGEVKGSASTSTSK